MRCRGQKVKEIGMIGSGVGGSRDDELCSLRGVFVCRTGLGDVMRSIDLSHSLNPPSAATRPSPDTTPYSNRPFSDPMQGPVHYWASGPVHCSSRPRESWTHIRYPIRVNQPFMTEPRDELFPALARGPSPSPLRSHHPGRSPAEEASRPPRRLTDRCRTTPCLRR